MKREEKIMLEEAAKVEGMHDTYKGQLSNYYYELDLSKEKKNIDDGNVYKDKYGDVKLEEICPECADTQKKIEKSRQVRDRVVAFANDLDKEERYDEKCLKDVGY